MRVIKFSVYNKRLRRITSGIISPKEYNQLKFEIDFRTSDWDLVKSKIANFVTDNKEYPIELDKNSQCYVPKEVLNADLFSVYISGDNIVTNTVGNLVGEDKSNPIEDNVEAIAALNDRIAILENNAVQTTDGIIDAGRIIERG